MQAGSLARAGFLGLLFIVLTGCEEGSPTGNKNFKAQYSEARNALESGKYDRANRVYAQLLLSAGPLAPRIRLELAHSQLRSGDYTKAANEARTIADTQSGAARSAALAVQGTAEHEIGLKALAAGDTDAGTQLLQSAHGAFEEVLEKNPELDPIGSLAGRHASIAARLKGRAP